MRNWLYCGMMSGRNCDGGTDEAEQIWMRLRGGWEELWWKYCDGRQKVSGSGGEAIAQVVRCAAAQPPRRWVEEDGGTAKHTTPAPTKAPGDFAAALFARSTRRLQRAIGSEQKRTRER